MDPMIFSTAEVLRFTIVLFRVAGIMLFAPFFNSRTIPHQVRAAATLVIALALVPSLSPEQVPQQFDLSSLPGCLLGEVLFGMVLGLVSSFVFAGMQLAGQIIGFQLGFSIINLIDPQSEVEASVISFLENYIGLLLFLLINGHHWFLLAVSESFQYLPVQGIQLQGPVVEEVLRLSGQILVTGVQIASPVIAVTLIADVVLGIIGRAAPHINILIVGMPLKTLVGFTCMSISFYFLPRLLDQRFAGLFRDLFAVLHKLA